MKPAQTLKLAFIVALLFASHAYALRLGWVFRDGEATVQQATVRALEQRIELLDVKREFWQRRARAAKKTILRSRQRIVEVSAYSACEAECDADPRIAASTRPPRPGTVAVSRDLFNMGWTFGKRVYLKGLGPYIINDVMNQRYQMRVDVFMDHKRAAREFGVRTTEAILG
ncbi:MAG: 3D domain-containing protein [Deltaproteobacteria bacterium]|nr:3D domain-containing protein [Deltaproteobacteria bacterium]